jgi:hypothetical protein
MPGVVSDNDGMWLFSIMSVVAMKTSERTDAPRPHSGVSSPAGLLQGPERPARHAEREAGMSTGQDVGKARISAEWTWGALHGIGGAVVG